MSTKLIRRLAVVALLIAGLMAVWNVDNRDGIHCGSWISPNTAAAGMADARGNTENSQRNLEEAMLRSGGDINAKVGSSGRDSSSTAQVDSCREARSARTPLIVGGAVIGFALLAFAITRSRTA